ncbi:uncharacterized protein LOC129544165 isoform X5 [Moschus berezovskii]|uniref:uncharacterized protein LOC129544165 isoform X5 n=1 Tax=Moschus berezovskii TaxID=68408 RepID=UPI0024446EBA|nr:uncharacterized protein LOC129544165 isoform X5 [Moschus berezovskii]
MLVSFVALPPARRRIQEQRSPYLLTSPLSPSNKQTKDSEIFVSSVTSVLMAFCFPVAQQEDLLEEQPQAGAEEPPQPTLKAAAEATEPASREDQLVEHLQAGAEEPPMPTGKAVGALKEHGFREDLPVNLLCDNTEESACFSKVAPSGCESDCFLESVSSSDAEENTATPDACCPQRPESCMAHIEDLEESKPVEIPKRSLVIFLKIPTGEVSSDDEEDLEEQE